MTKDAAVFFILIQNTKGFWPTRGRVTSTLSKLARGIAMATKLADTQRWQLNLVSLIRSGLLTKAETGQSNGLFTVHGVYTDGSHSAALAKYGDMRRAADAADLVNHLAKTAAPIGSN